MMIVRTLEICRKCDRQYRKIKDGKLVDSCPVCGTLSKPVKFETMLRLLQLAGKEKRTGCISLTEYGEI